MQFEFGIKLIILLSVGVVRVAAYSLVCIQMIYWCYKFCRSENNDNLGSNKHQASFIRERL